MDEDLDAYREKEAYGRQRRRKEETNNSNSKKIRVIAWQWRRQIDGVDTMPCSMMDKNRLYSHVLYG